MESWYTNAANMEFGASHVGFRTPFQYNNACRAAKATVREAINALMKLDNELEEAQNMNGVDGAQTLAIIKNALEKANDTLKRAKQTVTRYC
jgi:multidrug resistance efflux pump